MTCQKDTKRQNNLKNRGIFLHQIVFSKKSGKLFELLLYGRCEEDRIVLEGLRGEESIKDLCRKERIHPNKEEPFQKVTSFNDSLLCRFFTREVFLLLLCKQLITRDLVQRSEKPCYYPRIIMMDTDIIE